MYSVKGVGPRNVRPIKTLVPSVLIGFPTCLSTCDFAYLCADRIHHQRVHVRYADRARMASKHQQPDLLSWYCSTFTNCTMKFFSPVNNTWCIIVMLSLVVWSVCVHVFRGRDFGRQLQGGWDIRFQCYQAKVSIFHLLYRTFKL